MTRAVPDDLLVNFTWPNPFTSLLIFLKTSAKEKLSLKRKSRKMSSAGNRVRISTDVTVFVFAGSTPLTVAEFVCGKRHEGVKNDKNVNVLVKLRIPTVSARLHNIS